MKSRYHFIIATTLLITTLGYAQEYKTESLCDGYPRVPVSSFEGSCVGLVASPANKDEKGQSLKFPRKILELQPHVFLISDMGGWNPYSGKIWALDTSKNTIRVLLDKLTLPHALSIGPDGQVYVGEMGLIFRFNPYASQPALTCQTVVADLPSTVSRTKGNPCTDEVPSKVTSVISHPLVNFTFSKSPTYQWDLIVNTGSASDNCTDQNKNKKLDTTGRCLESDSTVPVASVRQYTYLGNGAWDSHFKILSRGLRNSMVLISHESGNIIQMENSMDFPEATEPFEEMNVLREGRHYGWPYCYNFKGKNPIYSSQKNVFLCDGSNPEYQEPYALIPPHAAPLDALYYEGDMFPELQHSLLVTWHGYKGSGQRLVAYPTNVDGLPYVSKDSFYYNSYDPNINKTIKIKANPQGGLTQTAQYKEVLFNWYKVNGVRPRGSPVGITVASDGSIFVVEDRNKTVLRISRGNGAGDSVDQGPSDAVSDKTLKDPRLMARWNQISQKVLQPKCAACHNQVIAKNDQDRLKQLVSNGWINPGNGRESLIVKRLKGGEMRQMPPTGPLSSNDIQVIEQFINDMK